MKIYDCVPGLEFDESLDFDISPCWFQDATHSVPPWTPMFGWFWVNFCRHGMQYGAEMLSLPTVKGWDWRFKDGGGYLALLIVKDPEERKAREDRFKVAIKPFIEDFGGMWKGFVGEMVGRYEKLKALDLDEATNIQLLDNFEETINVCRRMWEIHMYMMYGVYTAYVLFEQMTKQLLGIDDASPQFHKLTSGFDNKSFQVDKGLFDLAKKAQDMGLKDAFISTPASDMRNSLKSSQNGQDFLKAFDDFMEKEGGWRLERMAEINVPTWLEDPTPAFNVIKMGLEKGIDYNLEEERKKREAERLATEKEVLEKIAPEQRSWFKTILTLAQNSAWFSEEHNHYLDLYTHAMIRRSVMGMGRRFTKSGTIDTPEDMFFLIPDEVRKAGINPDMFNLRPIVNRRKAEWQGWCEKGNIPMFMKEGFTIEDAMKGLVESLDPIALKVVVGTMPVARPELKADLFGVCGSPGVYEGIVKVVWSESELSKIEKGDILVAPTTSPSWTPVFSLLGGVVVDRGASLSHAAIVGREFGIPVVMNTFEGTKILKDGMKIRLDANMGAIYILEK
ncbi:MAG: PEP-utilizing enzyme [Proteobacteria bacterium]|nr:PEP-utilizing enzyme [Pseudomonadota bacterium]